MWWVFGDLLPKVPLAQLRQTHQFGLLETQYNFLFLLRFLSSYEQCCRTGLRKPYAASLSLSSSLSLSLCVCVSVFVCVFLAGWLSHSVYVCVWPCMCACVWLAGMAHTVHRKHTRTITLNRLGEDKPSFAQQQPLSSLSPPGQLTRSCLPSERQTLIHWDGHFLGDM